MVDGRDMDLLNEVLLFQERYLEKNGNLPSLWEIWQWKEARSSVALDKGDGSTYTVESVPIKKSKRR